MSIKNQFRILGGIVAVIILLFAWVILGTDDHTTRKQKNESLFAPTTVINCQAGCSQCEPCLGKKKPELKFVSLAKTHGAPLVRPQAQRPRGATTQARGQAKSVGVLRQSGGQSLGNSANNQQQQYSWAFDAPEYYQGGGRSSYSAGSSYSVGSSNSFYGGGHISVSPSQVSRGGWGGGHGGHSGGHGPRVEVTEPQALLLMIGGLGLLVIRRITRK